MIHFPLSGTVDGASKVVALHVMLTLTKRKQNMGVSKNRGTPKWIFGGTPIYGNIHIALNKSFFRNQTC